MSINFNASAGSFDESKNGLGGKGDQWKIVILCKMFHSLQDGGYLFPPFEVHFLPLEETFSFVLDLEVYYFDLDMVLLLRLFFWNYYPHFLSFFFGLDEI